MSNYILYQRKHELLEHFLSRKYKETDLLKYTPSWIYQKVFIHSDLYIYEDNFHKVNLTENKSIDMMIKNKKEKDLQLRMGGNKLCFMYNFNDIFNNKNRRKGIYEDIKMRSSINGIDDEEVENVMYAKPLVDDTKQVQQNFKNQTNTDGNINTAFSINGTKLVGNGTTTTTTTNTNTDNNINNTTTTTNNYTNTNPNVRGTINKESSNSNNTNGYLNTLKELKEHPLIDYEASINKKSNFGFLFSIFKNEKRSDKTILKKSFIYNKLWLYLCHYKYINIMHILKAQYSLNILEITASILNISVYYDCLEDFVRHVVKHELFTLFNKNICYDTKIKVTKILDNLTVLLCLQNFNLAYVVDKNINICFEQLLKSEKEFLEDINQLVKLNEEKNEENKEKKEIETKIEKEVITRTPTEVEKRGGGGRRGGGGNGGEEEELFEKYLMQKKLFEKEMAQHTLISKHGNEEIKTIEENRNNKNGIYQKGIDIADTQYDVDDTQQSVNEDQHSTEETKRETQSFDKTKSVTLSELMGSVKDSLHREKEFPVTEKNKEEKLTKEEKKELLTFKRLKDYIYVYIGNMVNDLVKITARELNGNIRFLFYLIHDEIDGKNKNFVNKKKSSIHTLTLCLDLYLNYILYPYIFYIHEHNYITSENTNNKALYKKLILTFSQTVREISIYIFQIYNMGLYNDDVKIFLKNIKNNTILQGQSTNANLFFLDVTQKLFQWIIGIIEAPRYHSSVSFNFVENVETSFEKLVKEIVSIDEAATRNCVNENVDYNILFTTKNFSEILKLSYSILNDIY